MGTLSEFVTRDGCSLTYQEWGADRSSGAETLVLLSGWSQSAAMYEGLAQALGDQLHVVSYDHRNHGESGSSDNGARIATLATDLHELLDHLGVTTAHLLGNSLGCSVLYSYVDLYGTSQVSSLVLVDQPSVCALTPWLTPEDASEVGAIMDFQGANGFIQALLGPDSDATREAFLRSMILESTSESDVAFLLEQNMKLRLPFGAKLVLDHVMQDWRDVLPRIDVPTLVTGGEKSHVDPTSQRWIGEQIPGARTKIFTEEEGGDHFPFFQQPKIFAATLTDFLDGVRSART